MTGLEPNLVKERGRGRLRCGVEFCTQDVYADLIVAQCRCPLTALHMAAHHDAVRILTAGVVAQQAPCMVQTRVVIARTISVIRQIPQEG